MGKSLQESMFMELNLKLEFEWALTPLCTYGGNGPWKRFKFINYYVKLLEYVIWQPLLGLVSLSTIYVKSTVPNFQISCTDLTWSVHLKIYRTKICNISISCNTYFFLLHLNILVSVALDSSIDSYGCPEWTLHRIFCSSSYFYFCKKMFHFCEMYFISAKNILFSHMIFCFHKVYFI